MHGTFLLQKKYMEIWKPQINDVNSYKYLGMNFIMKCSRNLVLQHTLLTGKGAAIQGRKEMFYLSTFSTHFIYGYMASDIW